MDQTTEKTDAKIIYIVEAGQSTKIKLSIPSLFLFENVNNIDTAYKTILALTPSITELAKKAYKEQDKSAWNTVQTLLYYWNYRDLTRIERINGYNAFIEFALRKIVLDIQAEYTNYPILESCGSNFTPENAVKELAEHVHNHRINKHPLLEEMSRCGLSQLALKKFLENYYVNNRLFHLFIASLSLLSPFERRVELASNFYDEMGQGDIQMAHPVLFAKNFNAMGLPAMIEPLPESLSLVNAKTYAAFLSGNYHYGMGGFGYIELAMPDQMRKILLGLEKSGLSKADLEFWETHITLDLEHGETWFSEMLHLIKTPIDAQQCFEGGISLLNARASMYDGILRFL